MDFLSAGWLLKKAKDLCVSVQKCFDFHPPLWRVIKRGSSVRWMCNCISHSFSFFLSSPSHHLAFSIFFSVSAILMLSWLSSQLGELAPSYRPVRGIPTFVCVILAERCAVYANFNGRCVSVHVCTLDITHTHTQTDYLGSTCCLPPGPCTPLFSVNCSF